jgi:glycosyltransferase involved in cell wall biosynthesis
MQICFIEDTPYYGGGQEWIYDTIAEFKKLGHKINLIVPDKNKTLIDKAVSLGTNIYTYDWNNISKDTYSDTTTWRNALKNSDVAVCSVHPPRDNFHCVKFAGKCIRELNSKTILIPKTGTLVSSYTKDFYVPDPKIRTEIITITNFTKKNLSKNYTISSELIKTIYQGTNIDKFSSTEVTRNKAESKYGYKNTEKKAIGIVGMFEIRKGHIVLLEALKELKDKNILDLDVFFIGEGPTRLILQEKIKELKLENNVKIFPFTDEPQYFYDRIDALILPSLYKEGLPNVILEAMAMGKPCIASHLAGTAEVVKNEKTGYLVEPGNSTELASAIKKLLQSEAKLKKMGQNARKFVSNHFDRKKQAIKYLIPIIKKLFPY